MVSDARFHFDTTTWTRDGVQVSVRVVARAVNCFDYRTGREVPWADVEHVEALEPVWMDDSVTGKAMLLVQQGQDVTADLDIREGHRIQDDAERILEEERYAERDEMADLKREA